MSNKPSDAAIEGLYQDMGSLCTDISNGLVNDDLVITDDNANDWFAMHQRLFSLYDDIASLRRKSQRDPDAKPSAEYVPLYGVTNGRGRIIL